VGGLAFVGEIRNVYRILIGKLEGRELLGDVDGMMM
jgi:hypothetical protein